MRKKCSFESKQTVKNKKQNSSTAYRHFFFPQAKTYCASQYISHYLTGISPLQGTQSQLEYNTAPGEEEGVY